MIPREWATNAEESLLGDKEEVEIKEGWIVSSKVFFIIIALGFAIVALVLSTDWVTDGGAFYLGNVNWTTNLFSFHVVLMTGGFFFCQVFAISFMNLLKGSRWATPIHIVCHVAALSNLIAGMYAIIKNKNDKGSVHISSLHSWIGIMGISLYLCNFLLGVCGKAPAKPFGVAIKHPVAISIIGNVKPLRLLHVIAGLCAVCTCSMAILTGIMKVQQGNGGCTFDLSASELAANSKDPAYLYQYLANGCKVMNSLALAVIFATGCVCIATLLSLLAEAIPANTSIIKI